MNKRFTKKQHISLLKCIKSVTPNYWRYFVHLSIRKQQVRGIFDAENQREILLRHSKGETFRRPPEKSQVDGLNVFLNYWQQKFASEDDRWLAYMLGTAHHETDKKMQPINEYGSNRYFFEMYSKNGDRPKVAARLGNTEDGDGVRFHGRGFVQLTGRRNYQDMSNRLGVDLVGKPELALDT